MITRLLTLFIFFAVHLYAQQEDSVVPKPKPIFIKAEKPPTLQVVVLPEKSEFVKVATKLRKAKTLTPEGILALNHPEIKKDHEVYNLLPLFKSNYKFYTFHEKAWIIYNKNTDKLYIFTGPKIGRLIILMTHPKPQYNDEDPFNDDHQILHIPSQLGITMRILSIKRPAKLPKIWTKELIEKQDPIERAVFANVCKFGELVTLHDFTKNKEKYTNTLILEPTISEHLTHIDMNIKLTLASSTTQPGFTISTYLTTIANKPFIHPIGISTDPERIDILYIKPDLILMKEDEK